jgi:hypothetical protein
VSVIPVCILATMSMKQTRDDDDERERERGSENEFMGFKVWSVRNIGTAKLI